MQYYRGTCSHNHGGGGMNETKKIIQCLKKTGCNSFFCLIDCGRFFFLVRVSTKYDQGELFSRGREKSG